MDGIHNFDQTPSNFHDESLKLLKNLTSNYFKVQVSNNREYKKNKLIIQSMNYIHGEKMMLGRYI